MYHQPPVQQVAPIDTGSFLQWSTRRLGSCPTSLPVLPCMPAATAPATTLAAARVPGSLLPPPVYTRTGGGADPASSLPGQAGTPYAVGLGPGCQFRMAPSRLPASCRDRLRPGTTTAAAPTTPAVPWPGRRHEAAFQGEVLRILQAMEKEYAEKERQAERRRHVGGRTPVLSTRGETKEARPGNEEGGGRGGGGGGGAEAEGEGESLHSKWLKNQVLEVQSQGPRIPYPGVFTRLGDTQTSFKTGVPGPDPSTRARP